MTVTTREAAVVWKPTPWIWISVFLAAAFIAIIFSDSMANLFQVWEQEEYSHGYLIPFVALFLIWQKKDVLERLPFTGSWAGLGFCVFGSLIFLAGDLSAVHIIGQYALVMMIAGLALALLGWQGFRVILMPLLILGFMVPLPGFLYGGLSNYLQLISSEIGVWVIRLFGISVYLEGNVIDLGSFKLQVVEACSGLRYLFPLMTFGFIIAYFFQAPLWKRAVVFLSTIPITILMNSFRIGVIGVMVEYWGQSMAEGFLHDFEGWVVFMACTVILLIEVWLLARIGGSRQSFASVINIAMPRPTPRDAVVHRRSLPVPYLAALSLIVLVMIVLPLLPKQAGMPPEREELADFPLAVPGWKGKFEPMEQQFVDSLNFDDYLMANYISPQRELVNFYIGYYATQNKDKVPHSPSGCIPAGGWQIASLDRRMIDFDGTMPVGLASSAASPYLPVNSAVIQKGRDRQLVYYWFEQRGRVVTNELMVKWYIFWDSITQGRTDGALVRLVTPMPEGTDMDEAHRRLRDFTLRVYPELERFVPGRTPP